MAELIPRSWKQALANVREDISQAVARWLPKRQTQRRQDSDTGLPARWHAAVDQLRDEIHDALERWLPMRRTNGYGERDDWLPSLFATGGPLIEVEETDDDVIVLAEMPGLDRNDFTVEVTERRLVVRGERKAAAEE